MAWQDKTLEAKYTSPSGNEFPFHYEKVSRETNLKTGIFEFPDRDGAHVQHQGAGAKSFPLVCIFSGPDCMDKADAFEAALFERDVAELQHPVYGIIKVIPTGNIKREDDLVSALNESHVTVTFTETITGDATPMETVSLDEIEATYDEVLESAAADFAENISVDTVADELTLRSTLATEAQLIGDNMIPIVETNTAALGKFKEMMGELKSGINTLKSKITAAKNMARKTESFVVKGLNVARMILNIMKLPSKIFVNITEKIKGYSLLVTAIIKQFRNDPFGTKNIANAYHSTNLVLTGCIASIASGAAVSVARSATKPDKTRTNRSPAISSAPSGDVAGEGTAGNRVAGMSREDSVQIVDNLLSMLELTKQFQDSKLEKNMVVDSNSSTYLLLNKLVYSCVQLIMNVSLSLPMRRTIALNQDRQIIELVCELYGSVDYIDKFIADNDLSADELEVLPMGREVTYHVQVA